MKRPRIDQPHGFLAILVRFAVADRNSRLCRPQRDGLSAFTEVILQRLRHVGGADQDGPLIGFQNESPPQLRMSSLTNRSTA